MEPPYSYDRNAVPNDAMRAMGMAQGFDAPGMNQPYYNQQQQPPKYPFYPDMSGQHGGWPPPNSQMYPPHPYGQQGYGSFPAAMQGYGAYSMGQQAYGFPNQQPFGSFPHTQPPFPQMEDKPLSSGNMDQKSFPLPQPPFSHMDQQPTSSANTDQKSFPHGQPPFSQMNDIPSASAGLEEKAFRQVQPAFSQVNDVSASSANLNPASFSQVQPPFSLMEQKSPSSANLDQKSFPQAQPPFPRLDERPTNSGNPNHEPFDPTVHKQKPVEPNVHNQKRGGSDGIDQNSFPASVKPESPFSCTLMGSKSVMPNVSEAYKSDIAAPGERNGAVHSSSNSHESISSRKNKLETAHSGQVTPVSDPTMNDSVVPDETIREKENQNEPMQGSAVKASDSDRPGSELKEAKVDTQGASGPKKVKSKSHTSRRKAPKPKRMETPTSPVREDFWDDPPAASENTTDAEDHISEVCAKIKEEPCDEEGSPGRGEDDGSSLKKLFPNLVSSCNRDESELDASGEQENDESSEFAKTAADLNESSPKRELIHVPGKNLHKSMIPPSQRAGKKLAKATSVLPLVRPAGAGHPLIPAGLPAALPVVPGAPPALPTVPIPMTTKLDIVMAGMLNPYESGRKPTGPKQYICPACGKQLSDRGTLTRHLKIHTGERKHVCQYCSKTFIQSSELTKHIRTHTGEKPYACSQCERTFIDNSSLRHHMLNHTGEKKHKCHICGRAFAQIGNLRVHLKGKHADVSAFFNCTACGARFDKQRDLKAHLKTHAVGLPPRVLNQYGVDVNWQVPFGGGAPVPAVGTDAAKSDLPNPGVIDFNLVNKLAKNQDSSTSDDKSTEPEKDGSQKEGSSSPKECPDPDIPMSVTAKKSDITESSLAALPPGVAMIPDAGIAGPNTPSPAGMAAVAAAVMATKPVTSKPGYVLKDGVLFFVCQICYAEFNETPAFRQHMKTHTIKRPLPKLPCPVPGCDSILTGNSTLRRHLRIHAGARPHQCKECNKSFVHAHDLTVHMRVHTGERPYACTQCDRKFHDNSSYHRHRMWHTGQKPFVCPFCHKAFGQTGNLRVHMRSLHNADPDERYNCQFCPKSFCSVPTLDKHTMNKHSEHFPEGYKPAAGGRLGLGLGGVTGITNEDEPPRTSVQELMNYSVEAPTMNINTSQDDKDDDANSSTEPPPSKKSKQTANEDSNLSLASNENSNCDSSSNASFSEFNSRLDADSDSNPGTESNMAKSSSSDQPPYESAMRSMVSQLLSRLKKKHGIEKDESDVSDTSDEDDEDEDDEEAEEGMIKGQ